MELKKNLFKQETTERKKELEKLQQDGILGEEEVNRSMKLAHVEGLKYEWENFLANINISQDTFKKINEGTSPVNKDFADYVASTLKVPKKVIYNMLPLENKEKELQTLEEVKETKEETGAKKRGRPAGAKNKNPVESLGEKVIKVVGAKSSKNQEAIRELVSGFKGLAETLESLLDSEN